MSRIYVGPTALSRLGTVGELSLLRWFDGDVVVPEAVVDATTAEPTATNLVELREHDRAATVTVDEDDRERARALLGDKSIGSAASVVAGVLADRDTDDRSGVAVVSEDRTIRRLTRGLGGEVTSSFGVVVRGALEDRHMSPTQAKRVVRRLDQHGTHLTGELRERAIGEIGE